MTSRSGGNGAWPLRHAPFLAVLALGVAVRAVVMVAYRPALIFPDSLGYLVRAAPFQVFDWRPSGYSLFLVPFVHLAGPQPLALVAVTQHLIGLGLAVLGYALLVRRGLPSWGASLAVLPLLLDPLQLVMEHYILSDVLFEALLVGACLLVLWRHRPGVGSLVAAGAFVGCAGFVRGAGTFLLVVFVVALICLRVRWVKVVAFLVAAIVPLAAYAVAHHERYGQYAISSSGPRFLYARLAPVVHCDNPGLELPPYERMLCPSQPVGQRPSTDWYMWGQHQGPGWHVHGPKGTTQLQVLKDFDKRVVRAEPLVYSKAALTDLARGFSPTRTTQVPGYPSSYWLFADHYWSVDTFIHRHVMRPAIRQRFATGYGPSAASFMATYRQWVYTPGPVMAVLLLLAVGATLGLGRARRSGDRVAVGLLAAACLLPLLTSAALSGFSWRYQLPQIPLLPMAGALGLAALVRGRREGGPEPAPPLRVLDRWAGRSTRLSVLLAASTGAIAAVLFVLMGVASGWFAPLSAVVAGVVLGILLSVTLLLARAHAPSDASPTGAATGSAGPREPAGQR